MPFLSTTTCAILLNVIYQVKNTCGFVCCLILVFSAALCSGAQWGIAFPPQITENTDKKIFSWHYYCRGENINIWDVTFSWDSEIRYDSEILSEVKKLPMQLKKCRGFKVFLIRNNLI